MPTQFPFLNIVSNVAALMPFGTLMATSFRENRQNIAIFNMGMEFAILTV